MSIEATLKWIALTLVQVPGVQLMGSDIIWRCLQDLNLQPSD